MSSISRALLAILILYLHAANALPSLPGLGCAQSRELIFEDCAVLLAQQPQQYVKAECQAYLNTTVLLPRRTTTIFKTLTRYRPVFTTKVQTTWTTTTTTLPDTTVMTTSTVVSTLMRRDSPSAATYSSAQLPPDASQSCCSMNIYAMGCGIFGVTAATTTVTPVPRRIIMVKTFTSTIRHTQGTTQTATETQTISGTTDVIASFTTLPSAFPTSCGSTSKPFYLKQTTGFAFYQSDGPTYFGYNVPYLTIGSQGVYQVNATVDNAAVFVRNSDCSLASVDSGKTISIAAPDQTYSYVSPKAGDVQLLASFDSDNTAYFALSSDPQRIVPSFWQAYCTNSWIGSWIFPSNSDGSDPGYIFNRDTITFVAEFLE